MILENIIKCCKSGGWNGSFRVSVLPAAFGDDHILKPNAKTRLLSGRLEEPASRSLRRRRLAMLTSASCIPPVA